MLLRHVIDSLTEAVVVVGVGGEPLLCNASARRLLGEGIGATPADEWASRLGWLQADMATPCTASEMPLARALRGETVSNLELFMLDRESAKGVWLSINGAPIRDARGRIEGGVVVLRDVTATKLKVQQIELLSNVIEATADAVIVTDLGGRIKYVNPAFEASTGYSRSEVLGRNPSLLKSGAHTREFYSDLWRTVVEGEVFHGTLINRKKNGELSICEQTISPIRAPSGAISHVVSVGKDVTQLRRAAERESSLLLARSVQQRLLPSSAPAVPGFDISGSSFVADVTGGDYYDFIPLPNECLGILVADVSGHGVDSALLMAETRAVLRATSQSTSDPSEILTVVNRVLHADTEDHRFATLLLVSLHLPSCSVSYSSAGHTSGYLLDRSGATRNVLSATGVPLGLFAGSGYETRAASRLAPGDALVLLTDGVTDSGAPEGDQFGAQRALEVIRSSLGLASAGIVDGLYRAVRSFEDGGPQRDDVTIVVVRRLPREEVLCPPAADVAKG